MINPNHSVEMQRCIRDCDVAAARRLWRYIAPHLHQPRDDHEVLATLHYARTVALFMPLRGRAYSHRWLLDHGIPSGLPDNLKPAAERMYPKIVEGVGIAVMGRTPELATAIKRTMSQSVLETYGDGVKDPVIIRRRMFEAKDNLLKKLVGRITTNGGR